MLIRIFFACNNIVAQGTVTQERFAGLGSIVENVGADGFAKNLAHLRPAKWSNHSGFHDQVLAACELPAFSGHRTGVCQDDVQSQLTFCKDVVRYRTCVPAHQPTWDIWDATKKDDLLGSLYKKFVERRLAKEASLTAKEYVEMHYLANPECMAAYKHVLCWYNFPKCGDNNVSLPLCRRSCERYYEACNYEPSTIDGLHDACRASTTERTGLFETGINGTDQRLGEDTAVCESTKAEAALIPDEAPPPDWYTTWWGITPLVCLGIAVCFSIYYLLMAYGFRVYIAWAIWRTVTYPHRLWKRLPVLTGRTIVGALALTLLALLAYGAFRRAAPKSLGGDEGGYDRFKESRDQTAKDREALVGENGAGYRGFQNRTQSLLSCQKWTEQVPHQHQMLELYPQAGLGDHNFCRNPTPGRMETIWCFTTDPNKPYEVCHPIMEFKPPPATHEIDTYQPLQPKAVKQLIAGCTCTGGAARAHPRPLVRGATAAVALASAGALLAMR